MKIKRMVKRLFALSAGAAMLGATAMGALAADLNKYPDFLAKDGTFDGFFVVGENAKPVDNLAMTDIASSMKWLKPAEKKVTTVTGDAWQVGTGSKKFELTNTNTTPAGENIYDIETFIGKGDLAALADGTYTTNAGSYGYSQYLYFDKNNDVNNELVVFRESDDDITADFLQIEGSNSNIGEFRLEFTSTPQSTVQDTAGAVSASGTVLDDFENTKIKFFGKEFTIVLARRPGSRPEDTIKLTIMGGATSGNLLEGETSTVKIGGDSYEVSLAYVDTTYAKFTVNGEQTNKLQVGDTYKLSSGKEIGVSELLYQSYAGGIHSAKFFLGAQKMVLEDNNINDNASSKELVVGSDTIDGADAIITGSDDNSTYQLTSIRVNMTAQDSYYVPAKGKLSDAIKAEGDEKELLFTNTWEIEYLGLSEEETHDIKLASSTDRKYKLQFYDGDNNKVDMPLAYATNNSHIQLSEELDEKDVVFNEGINISKNDYFVVTGGTASDGTARTYALQYKGADKNTATSPQIKFKNLGNSETLSYNVDTATSGTTVATLKIGGYSFIVQNVTDKGTADFDIEVDLNAGGTLEADAEIDVVDYYGAQIDFGGAASRNTTGGIEDYYAPNNVNQTLLQVNISVPNNNDYDNLVPGLYKLDVDATTTNEVTVSAFNFGGVSNPSITPEGEQNIGYGMDSMGAKWTYTTPSGSPNEFTLASPKKQRLPQVYVTAAGAEASTDGGGTLTPVTVVDATKLDSEIADAKAQNLLVVGGPCVNSIAAELLGSPADCTTGFAPGKARIKLFEHANGKVAMLVAGYSGADTRLAGKVVAHRWQELSGKEVEVEGTTYSDATIGAPAVVETATTETTTTTTTSS